MYHVSRYPTLGSAVSDSQTGARMQIDNDLVDDFVRMVRNELNTREQAMLTDILVARLAITSNSEVRRKSAKVYVRSVYGTKEVIPSAILDMESKF